MPQLGAVYQPPNSDAFRHSVTDTSQPIRPIAFPNSIPHDPQADADL